MTQDTFKAWRKAYQAGKQYAQTKAYEQGDGDSLSAYAKAKYADENARAMFVQGVYAYRPKGWQGSPWSGFDSQECDC